LINNVLPNHERDAAYPSHQALALGLDKFALLRPFVGAEVLLYNSSKFTAAGIGGNVFGLNPFELAMMTVFCVLVIAATRSLTETPLALSGRKRLLIYGLVLLTCAVAFLNIIESKTGMIFAR